MREDLPHRRDCWRFPIEFNGQHFTVQISLFDDGRPAETFVTGLKSGSDVQHLSRDGAILLSLALQYGAPVDVVRKSLARDEQENPSSLIGAIADAIVHEAFWFKSLKDMQSEGGAAE